MAATVEIRSYHGATADAGTSVSAIRFKRADNDTADANSRVPIPATGTNYSYIKHLALYATTAPAAIIDTVTVYGDGALPTGVGMCLLDAIYKNPLTNGSIALAVFSNNYAGYTSDAPLSLAGTIENPNTGKINTNYLQMQMSVADTAAAGAISAETLTFSYLES